MFAVCREPAAFASRGGRKRMRHGAFVRLAEVETVGGDLLRAFTAVPVTPVAPLAAAA